MNALLSIDTGMGKDAAGRWGGDVGRWGFLLTLHWQRPLKECSASYACAHSLGGIGSLETSKQRALNAPAIVLYLEETNEPEVCPDRSLKCNDCSHNNYRLVKNK